jgi:ABC-type transport system involved in Fe-S cluster assembly fused permease/ATPase subunit
MSEAERRPGTPSGRATLAMLANKASTTKLIVAAICGAFGSIVETGRHDELMKHGGVYRKLYELPFAS